ncbi:MAG TPA: sugar phosphate isomerase/epimerase family protein [Candidatus Aquilonibacter sp.]|nr:sugar phosphate isomerase/epimerase family protein [Candidatus Aquilonibacter sp.]
MNLSRREILGGTTVLMGAAMASGVSASAEAQRARRTANEPFGYCLNMSTIRGNNLDVPAQVDVAAKAGYNAIEPWAREIEAYTAKGGTLKDLAKRIKDSGLTVEDVIAFNAWLDDDDTRRAAAMENLKREMDMVAQIGGKRIATPPGQNGNGVSLDHAAEYYRAALELGEQMGVLPLCELWGQSPVLGPLSHGAYVTIGTGRGDASMLLDIFHVYKSGTSFASLDQINGAALHVIHVNDYPAADDPSKLTDANRVYPGDGVAPLGQIFRDLHDNGFRGVLSLELFNKDYWKLSAEENARTGLEKTRAAVRKALA